MSETAHDPLLIAQVPVGELVGREIEARGWSQGDFAAVLDRPTPFVSEIVNDKKEITRESAAQNGAALGHTAEYWLHLQDQYLLAEQGKNENTRVKLDEVRRRALLNGKGPIQLLRKRGFLSGTTVDALEAEVKELFELRSLDDEPAFAAAAKRANRDEDAWAQRWLDRQTHLKPTTRSRYEGIVRKHIHPKWDRVKLANVSHGDVQAWVTELARGHSPATVHKIHRVLSLVLDMAVKDERLVRNVANLPRVPLSHPRAGGRPCQGDRLPERREQVQQHGHPRQ